MLFANAILPKDSDSEMCFCEVFWPRRFAEMPPSLSDGAVKLFLQLVSLRNDYLPCVLNSPVVFVRREQKE